MCFASRSVTNEIFGGDKSVKMKEGGQRRARQEAGTCSSVLSDLLRAFEHAQLFPLTPRVSKNIPGLLLSVATHSHTRINSVSESRGDGNPMISKPF